MHFIPFLTLWQSEVPFLVKLPCQKYKTSVTYFYVMFTNLTDMQLSITTYSP